MGLLMDPTQHTHRVFLALWPDDALRERIAASVEPLIRGKNARPIPADNLHITLAFLGEVPARLLPSVRVAASQVESEPLLLRLERIETWAGARILCLTPEMSPPLNALVERLRISLSAHGLEPDQKDFRAHVTLAREWRDPDMYGSIGLLEWSAHEFVLVESEAVGTSSSYRVIGRWSLTGTRQ